MSETHTTPMTGSRRIPFRKNNNAAAERQNAAVKDAHQATGEALRQVRLVLHPPKP